LVLTPDGLRRFAKGQDAVGIQIALPILLITPQTYVFVKSSQFNLANHQFYPAIAVISVSHERFSEAQIASDPAGNQHEIASFAICNRLPANKLRNAIDNANQVVWGLMAKAVKCMRIGDVHRSRQAKIDQKEVCHGRVGS
jgi:hypothetical protein